LQIASPPEQLRPHVPQPIEKGPVLRSPRLQLRTSLPVSCTVPANSCPGTCGTFTSASWPFHPCQSERQRPEAPTFTTTPSGVGVGSGTSTSCSGPSKVS